MQSRRLPNPLAVAAVLFALGAAAFMIGCASVAPSARFSRKPDLGEGLRANDGIQVRVSGAPGVALSDEDKAALGDLIASRIEDKKRIDSAQLPARELLVDVVVTRFADGSAPVQGGVVRLNLDGEVTVKEEAEGEPVARFRLTKAVSWDPSNGGKNPTPKMAVAFAKGVANGLTGQGE